MIQYHLRNPCEIFESMISSDMEENGNSRWTNHTITRFNQLCTEDFDNVWRPKFEAFAKCTTNHGVIRRKRFIWFAVGTLYIVQLITSVVATAVVVDKQINNLKENLSDAKLMAKQAIDALKTQDDINYRTVTAVNNITTRTANLMIGMDSYSQMLPEAVWSGMKVYDALRSSSDMLEEMEYDCSQHKQINTVALSKLTGQLNLRDTDKRDTHGITIERLASNEILIQFLSPGTSKDTTIHQVGHFLKPVNLTTNPTLLRYAGPEYLIHNTTSNCTRGIEEPRRDRISLSCIRTNYSDPRLALWITTNITIDDIEPQIILKGDQAHIMCLSKDITVYNVTTPCPAWPLSLPSDISFQAGNLYHEARIVRTNGTRMISPNKFIHLNETLQGEEELKEQISFIRTIQHLNDELRGLLKDREGSLAVKLGDFGISSLTLTDIPWLSLFKWVSGTPLVLVLLYWSLRSRGGREHVTVVNSPATRDPTPVREPTPFYNLYPPMQGVRFGSSTTIG